MKKTTTLLVMLQFCTPVKPESQLWGQVDEEVVTVRGVIVYGMDNERNFPVVVRDSLDRDGRPLVVTQYITIQFDVLASEPPPLKIRFYHCNRDWDRDRSSLIQDENYNTSFILDFRTSPNGVEHYAYRYINRFPDENDIVRFDYSGNWLFEIIDKEETRVYADGRFFVVDNLSPTSVMIMNDYLTANESPLNQIHRIHVDVQLPSETEGYFYTTLDVYQNRRLHNPYRIDAYDRDPYTKVDGFNTGTRQFKKFDVYPGNEYRVLDLSNATRYPNKSVVRRVEGADLARTFWRTGADHNGTAVLNTFTGITSDYLKVLFRLDLTESDGRRFTNDGRSIYLVGSFNDWNPTLADRLLYDNDERSWVVQKLIRRGIYDYQYISGTWNQQTGRCEEQDWLGLEGNDWRTTNTYAAVVYYNDPRFGGFDRIVGFGLATSAPTAEGSY